MSIIDGLAKKLAIRWAQGKISTARKEGSGVLKALDGQKRLIVVLGFIVSGFVAMVTGQDISQWLELALRALGWSDAGIIEGAKDLATQIVPLLFAIWASGHALWKLYKERKAGASIAEMGAAGGAIKAAVASGDLVVRNNTITDPAVLELKEVPVTAKADGMVVTP